MSRVGFAKKMATRLWTEGFKNGTGSRSMAQSLRNMVMEWASKLAVLLLLPLWGLVRLLRAIGRGWASSSWGLGSERWFSKSRLGLEARFKVLARRSEARTWRWAKPMSRWMLLVMGAGGSSPWAASRLKVWCLRAVFALFMVGLVVSVTCMLILFFVIRGLPDAVSGASRSFAVWIDGESQSERSQCALWVGEISDWAIWSLLELWPFSWGFCAVRGVVRAMALVAKRRPDIVERLGSPSSKLSIVRCNAFAMAAKTRRLVELTSPFGGECFGRAGRAAGFELWMSEDLARGALRPIGMMAWLLGDVHIMEHGFMVTPLSLVAEVAREEKWDSEDPRIHWLRWVEAMAESEVIANQSRAAVQRRAALDGDEQDAPAMGRVVGTSRARRL